MLQLASCAVDLTTGVVVGGAVPALTERERALLAYLAARPGEVVARDTLLVEVWGYSDQVLSRAVDSCVRRLREKLEVDPAHPRHVLTVHGAGYRFAPHRPDDDGDAVQPAVAPPPGPRRRLSVGDRVIDLDHGVVRGPTGQATLTAIEIELLRFLGDHPGMVGRRELIRAAWGDRSAGRGALDNALHRLRAKIEPDSDAPRFLLTVRGAGVRLVQGTGPADRARLTLTLVHVAPWRERALWSAATVDPEHTEPARATAAALGDVLGRLHAAALAAGGTPTGGGWRYLFVDPVSALRFAADAVAHPDGGGVVLRAGVHCGHPVTWSDPISGATDCLGPEVHRAEDLLHAAPPAGVAVDEGLWDRVGEESGLAGRSSGRGAVVVGGDGAGDGNLPAGADPAIRGLTRPDLPWRGDRFVGRDVELTDLLARLASGARLVTVVGPAGVGKSRLTVEVCARIVREAGVWRVPLAGAVSRAAIDAAVADTLGLAPTAASSPDGLVEALRRRGPTALWFDDAERAADILRDAVAHWLAGAPALTVIASSRVALGARGEDVVELVPLPDDDAVELFVARAPVPVDPAEVRELAAVLDGLPLAIELAAARTAAMSPRRILERMPDRLRILAAPDRRDLRHGSLRAALEVSWDLLDPWQRGTLAGCAVFDGGFTLVAAEDVLQDDAPGAPWVVDVVEALVRHHLVRVDHDRYTLLDSVRAFADEHLAPAARARLEQRHARHYAALGAADALRTLRRGVPQILAGAVSEVGNLARAADRADDPAISDAAVLALAELAAQRQSWTQHVERVDAALARATPSARRAELLLARGRLLHQRAPPASVAAALREAVEVANADGDLVVGSLAETLLGTASHDLLPAAAREAHHDRALGIARSRGLPEVEVEALLGLAQCAAVGSPAQAELLEQALAVARGAGDVAREGLTLGMLGVHAFTRHRYRRAEELYKAALVCHGRAGNRAGEATALGNLANAVRFEEPARAIAHYRAAQAIYRQVGNRRGEAMCLVNLGAVHNELGELGAACGALDEGVSLLAGLGVPRIEAHARANLAGIYLRLDRDDEGREQLERALPLAEGSGNDGALIVILYNLALLTDGAEAVALLDRAEAVRGPNDLVMGAMVRCQRAIALAPTDPEAAAAALAAADGLIAEMSAGDRARFAATTHVLADARAALGAHAPTIATRRG